MENTAVLHVMEIIAATFPGQGGGSGGDQPPAFVAGEVARRLGTAAQTLLAGYVEAHGRQLTIAVRRSVDSTNWLQVTLTRSCLHAHLLGAETQVEPVTCCWVVSAEGNVFDIESYLSQAECTVFVFSVVP